MRGFTTRPKDGYNGALRLIAALKEEGIQANIIDGGVAISIRKGQRGAMRRICYMQNGFYPHRSY